MEPSRLVLIAAGAVTTFACRPRGVLQPLKNQNQIKRRSHSLWIRSADVSATDTCIKKSFSSTCMSGMHTTKL